MMTFSGMSWLFTGFTIFTINQRGHTARNGQEVYISQDLCGRTVDLHQREFKRLLFSNSPCGNLFTCTVTFSSDNHNVLGAICVDYSRLQLRGDRTFFNISVLTSTGDLSLWRKKVALSGKEQKPSKIGKHKDSVICSSALETVVLDFSIECNTSLDDAVRSWLYVYSKRMGTNTLYFLDGTCFHQHSLYRVDYDTIFLQSRFWNDVHSEWKNQTCSIRVGISGRFSGFHFCIKWKKTSSVLPPGVSLNVKSFKSSLAKSATSYLSLQAGDRFPQDKSCFPVGFMQNSFFIEVNRQSDRAKNESYPKNGMAIFSAKVGLWKLDPVIDEDEKPPVYAVDEKYMKTTRSNIEEDGLQTPVSQAEEENFSVSPWILKIGGAVAAVLGIVCCLSVVSGRQNQRSSDSSSVASSRGSLNHEIDFNDPDLRTAVHLEAQPMVHEIPSAPPAPVLEMDDFRETDLNEPDDFRETDLNEPPPSYQSQPQEPPPAYSDLFPTS